MLVEVKNPCVICENKKEISQYSDDIEPCNTCRCNTKSRNWRVPHAPYKINFKEVKT
jgi:hypothetical protein